ncbi:MAG: hypothetical protein D6696_13315 [Acidobacteria bacterium]|nr:MAG: hypothetical protein D6696_13315 [Acidobacteriota bacterium]
MAEVRALRQRLEEDPNDREALRRLAGLQFQISNWSRAIELFERLLALEPNDVVTMTDLGVSYRGAGQLDRALELFRRAYETDPSYWQAAFNEAYVLGFDRGDWAAAQRVVDELQARQPDNADVARLAEEIARRRQAAPPADGAS